MAQHLAVIVDLPRDVGGPCLGQINLLAEFTGIATGRTIDIKRDQTPRRSIYEKPDRTSLAPQFKGRRARASKDVGADALAEVASPKDDGGNLKRLPQRAHV